MILAVSLTLLVCTVLLLVALRRIDGELGTARVAESRPRPPASLGRSRQGFGFLASGLETLIGRGLAVRPPPGLSG